MFAAFQWRSLPIVVSWISNFHLRSIVKSACLIALCLAPLAFAAPTVTVLSPKSASQSGSPVFYEAYATSPGCASGISAMRIYTASGVNAYTVFGAHIETFITLAPGTYNTVVQAWDNCGGVAKTPVAVTVNQTAGVSVFLPRSGVSNTPQHLAASAQNPACPAGMSAMRIYTANGTSPYTVLSNHLNTFVNLAPGTYTLTVQAWDNCGHVYKNQFTQSGGGGSDGYLYAVNDGQGKVVQFDIANGVLANPNGSGNPPSYAAGSGADEIAVDPGSWFAYVTTSNAIVGYQIDQSNGALRPMPGSPFPLNGTGPRDVSIDPNGNFLFATYNSSNTVAVYKIDRSSGAITNTANFTGADYMMAAIADFTGQYLYAINIGNYNSTPYVWAYRINQSDGSLTQVPGSPYPLPNGGIGAMLSSPSIGGLPYLYAATGHQQIYANAVGYSTGELTEIAGSPYQTIEDFGYPQSMIVDNQARYLWTVNQAPMTYPPQNWFTVYNVDSNGMLSNYTVEQTGTLGSVAMIQDGSSYYVYTVGNNCATNPCYGVVASWKIASNGELTLFSGPLNTGPSATEVDTANTTSLGVAQKLGN